MGLKLDWGVQSRVEVLNNLNLSHQCSVFFLHFSKVWSSRGLLHQCSRAGLESHRLLLVSPNHPIRTKHWEHHENTFEIYHYIQAGQVKIIMIKAWSMTVSNTNLRNLSTTKEHHCSISLYWRIDGLCSAFHLMNDRKSQSPFDCQKRKESFEWSSSFLFGAL